MSVNNSKIEQNEILSLLKERKEKGMRLLIDNYFDELFCYCFNQTGNKEDSEDILQTVFIDLWQNCNKRDISDLKPYLYQMLKYQIYGYWATKKDTTELVEEFNNIISANEIEQIIETKELEKSLSFAVNSLPDACKTIFELSRYDELSLDNIASKLNISKQTVKNQLTKALKLIRDYLDIKKSLTAIEISILILPLIFSNIK
jgi:RNA polymerase sigma-70 factor (ECF subfamily)